MLLSVVAGSVENEESMWRIIYHDGDGGDISETEVVRLKDPAE